MKTNFKLNYLSYNDPPDGKLYTYPFRSDDSNYFNEHYSTIIIGPNGTGKSRLLTTLISIFNDLYLIKNNKINRFKRFEKFFELGYSIGENNYQILYNNDGLVCLCDTEKIETDKIELPDKGIAAAYSLHEKFSPKDKSLINYRPGRFNNDFYEYLGIKSNRNYAFSSANISNAIDLITEAICEHGFDKDLFNVFTVLNFHPYLTIRYDVKRFKELYSGNATPESVLHQLGRYSGASSFSYSSANKLKEADEAKILQVVESLNYVAKILNHKNQFALDVSFERTGDYQSFNEVFLHISTLRKANLISYEQIQVFKKNSNTLFSNDIHSLNSMSSGEIHIITSLLSLAAVVKQNSLVLIDEPEISLHPNWQIQYMDLLHKIFKGSSGCHFIIATHSHFLVSDMLPEASSILSLIADNEGNIHPRIIPSAYGWSAENVLYNIFGVATVRNHYFEMDVKELLKLISKPQKNKSRINYLINKFEKFKLLPQDPLKQLIDDAKKFIELI